MGWWHWLERFMRLFYPKKFAAIKSDFRAQEMWFNVMKKQQIIKIMVLLTLALYSSVRNLFWYSMLFLLPFQVWRHINLIVWYHLRNFQRYRYDLSSFISLRALPSMQRKTFWWRSLIGRYAGLRFAADSLYQFNGDWLYLFNGGSLYLFNG